MNDTVKRAIAALRTSQTMHAGPRKEVDEIIAEMEGWDLDAETRRADEAETALNAITSDENIVVAVLGRAKTRIEGIEAERDAEKARADAAEALKRMADVEAADYQKKYQHALNDLVRAEAQRDEVGVQYDAAQAEIARLTKRLIAAEEVWHLACELDNVSGLGRGTDFEQAALFNAALEYGKSINFCAVPGDVLADKKGGE